MVRSRKSPRAVLAAAGTVALCALVACGSGGAHGADVGQQAAAAADPLRAIRWQGAAPSAEARSVADWALHQNALGKPFAVVDKKQARIHVFAADGTLVGTTPVLLGLTRGDDSAPGIGRRANQGSIGREERTTPAGRFDSQPGRNNKGEAIVWVDYTAAVAIHRLRPAAAAEQRPQRLASSTPDDNRISLGCVIVGVDFYDNVVATTLGKHRGVVYVLPETRSLAAAFGAGYAAFTAAASAAL